MDYGCTSGLREQNSKRLLPIGHKARMDICLEMNSPLQRTIVVKFDPVAADIIAAPHLANFVEEGDHMEMLRAFDKNPSFGADGSHPPGGSFDTIGNNCMFDFVETARSLDPDGSIHIQSDDRSKL